MCRPWSVKCRVWSVKCSLSIEKMKCTARRIYQWSQDEKELLYLQRWTMWTSEQHVVNDLTDGIWKMMLYCTSTRWINSHREFGATQLLEAHNCTLFRRKTCAQQMQEKITDTQFVNEPSTERQQQPISTHRLASHLIREKNRCVCDLLSYPRHNIDIYTWPALAFRFIDWAVQVEAACHLWPCKELRWEVPSTPCLINLKLNFEGASWRCLEIAVDSHTHTPTHTFTHTHKHFPGFHLENAAVCVIRRSFLNAFAT